MVQRMILAFALALFGIYALMAIPLKSYGQPLIIMGVIPFGMIGGLIGHVVVGIPFSALSVYVIVALAGVVVNDSIILVDFVNVSNHLLWSTADPDRDWPVCSISYPYCGFTRLRHLICDRHHARCYPVPLRNY